MKVCLLVSKLVSACQCACMLESLCFFKFVYVFVMLSMASLNENLLLSFESVKLY